VGIRGQCPPWLHQHLYPPCFLYPTSTSVEMGAIDTLIRSFFDETWIFVFFLREVLRMNKILPCAAPVAVPFKIGLKMLFKKAAMPSAILLIFMHVSSPLRAAEAAPDPAGFDILGMKLGMSVAQIEAAIKAYNPSLSISTSDYVSGNPDLTGVGKRKFIQFVVATQPGALADTIAVGFTATQPSKVFYIGRLKQYSLEEQPLADKTLQQLREKYGPESGSSTPIAGQLVGRTVLEWGGDKAGKHPFQSCVPKGPAPFWYAADFRFGSLTTHGYYWPACGTDLLIELQPWRDPHLLSYLREDLTAHSIAIDDIQKLMLEAKAEKEQQRQQQEQKASGVKPVL
jgi:hypothetical protein